MRNREPQRKRSDGENKQTGREARQSALPLRPAIRVLGRHFFDAKTGSPVSEGVVEVRLDVRIGEGFVCPRDGILRPVRQGCGRDCGCLQCDTEPRRDGRPPKATVVTCGCIRCQQRRQRRS